MKENLTIGKRVLKLELDLKKIVSKIDIILLKLVKSRPKEYLEYTATLTQTGTNAPIANVLKNTVGDIVWTRFATGIYHGTLTTAFTLDKTAVFITKGEFAANDFVAAAARVNNNIVQILQKDVSDSFTDEFGIGISIEIRVYL